MTLVSFFGCTFIAFGPAFSMFVLTVASDAQQVIVLISSAFFWLVSLLTSSILWTVVSPLKHYLAFSLVFSVLFQELFRFFFWILLRRAEEGLQIMTNSHSPLRKIHFHYVSGLGFGLMSGLFAMVNILAEISGPGTIGLAGDDPHFVVVSAFLTNCIILLHTFWGVIFFNGLDRKKWSYVCVVVLSHLLVSALTLFNKHHITWPALTVGHAVLAITAVWSFFNVGGSVDNLKRSMKLSSLATTTDTTDTETEAS